MNPFIGIPVLLQSHPSCCPVCWGARVVQLRALAEPRCPRGGRFRCPQCTPQDLPRDEALSIPLVPWHQETPRGGKAA